MKFSIMVLCLGLISSCAQLDIEKKIGDLIQGKDSNARQKWDNLDDEVYRYVSDDKRDRTPLKLGEIEKVYNEVYSGGSCYGVSGEKIDKSICESVGAFLKDLDELREKYLKLKNIESKIDQTEPNSSRQTTCSESFDRCTPEQLERITSTNDIRFCKEELSNRSSMRKNLLAQIDKSLSDQAKPILNWFHSEMRKLLTNDEEEKALACIIKNEGSLSSKTKKFDKDRDECHKIDLQVNRLMQETGTVSNEIYSHPSIALSEKKSKAYGKRLEETAKRNNEKMSDLLEKKENLNCD